MVLGVAVAGTPLTTSVCMTIILYNMEQPLVSSGDPYNWKVRDARGEMEINEPAGEPQASLPCRHALYRGVVPSGAARLTKNAICSCSSCLVSCSSPSRHAPSSAERVGRIRAPPSGPLSW